MKERGTARESKKDTKIPNHLKNDEDILKADVNINIPTFYKCFSINNNTCACLFNFFSFLFSFFLFFLVLFKFVVVVVVVVIFQIKNNKK